MTKVLIDNIKFNELVLCQVQNVGIGPSRESEFPRTIHTFSVRGNSDSRPIFKNIDLTKHQTLVIYLVRFCVLNSLNTPPFIPPRAGGGTFEPRTQVLSIIDV